MISRANHTYIYKLCWIDLENNKWGFQFIPHSNSILSISLACYRNELLCFINDGRNIVWSIEKTKNQNDSTNSSISNGCLESGLRWSFMSNLTSRINGKCSGYFPVAALDNYMLMCKYDHLTFGFYDFNDAHSNFVGEDRMLDSALSKLENQTHLTVVELVDNISIILSSPNMDSIEDVFSMG